MLKANQVYVVGVDGGGTKTVAALADLNGKILKTRKTGPASARNIGLKNAAKNVIEAIVKILPGKKIKISSVFIGLPGIQERPELAPKIRKELLKDRRIYRVFKGKFKIASDQIVAFRTGTDKKDGVVLIAGTGCVAHGWRKGKEVKASGWGWLADEGSAFWTGQRGYQEILKELDGRGPQTLITKLVFRKWRPKRRKDLREKIYSGDFVRQIASMSGVIDLAAEKGDSKAFSIMKAASEELALSAATVIKQLRFRNEEFILVLIGRMFKSRNVLNNLKKIIKKFAPKVEFIRPKKEPVIGAVKLAIEALDNKGD